MTATAAATFGSSGQLDGERRLLAAVVAAQQQRTLERFCESPGVKSPRATRPSSPPGRWRLWKLQCVPGATGVCGPVKLGDELS
jgi:hypothetical protein